MCSVRYGYIYIPVGYQNSLNYMDDYRKDLLSNDMRYAQPLPNATATLVLGILSIVVCLVCGIVALVISGKDMRLYRATPELYDAGSYNNLKAGRICAVIGIVLQSLFLVIYIAFIAFAVYSAR